MAESKNKNFFWVGYSDLMTNLFFVFLVLFVIVFALVVNNEDEISKYEKEIAEYKSQNENLNATVEQLKYITQIDEQFSQLNKSEFLEYDATNKTFVAKALQGKEIFEHESDIIKTEYLSTVDEVGRQIERMIKRLHYLSPDMDYLLVIEGTAAIPWDKLRDESYNPDNRRMYELSYRRALALYYRWKGINFRKFNTEVLICGSGYSGNNRDNIKEENNKRFIVQIIPKVANSQRY